MRGRRDRLTSTLGRLRQEYADAVTGKAFKELTPDERTAYVAAIGRIIDASEAAHLVLTEATHRIEPQLRKTS